MFRSSTIIRDHALKMAKVIFMLKHSVKLGRNLLCGCVASSCSMLPHNRIINNDVRGVIKKYGECLNKKKFLR